VLRIRSHEIFENYVHLRNLWGFVCAIFDEYPIFVALSKGQSSEVVTTTFECWNGKSGDLGTIL
jgi:hypothetical protein